MSKNRPFVIGICGGSGSGKTSFVKSLVKELDSSKICILSQDMYYKSREEQNFDENGIQNFDLPEGIHRELLFEHIKRLLNGESVNKTEYTFNNAEKEPKSIVYQADKVLIIEGLFIFHYAEIKALFDISIFIDAYEEIKINRRITRDSQERNYPLDDVLYRYENHVSPSFRQYILPYKNDADIVINNNNNYDSALKLVRSYLKNIIQ